MSCFTPSGLNVLDYVYNHSLYFCVDNFDPTLSDCRCLLHFLQTFLLNLTPFDLKILLSNVKRRFYKLKKRAWLFKNEHLGDSLLSFDKASTNLETNYSMQLPDI